MAVSLVGRALGPAAAIFRGLFRTHCVLCGAGAAHWWCDPCRAELPGVHAPRCPVCAEESAGAQICGRCLRAVPAFSRTFTATSYAFPVDALVQRFKYAPDLSLARPLAELLLERARSQRAPDLVIGMPLSPRRVRERGFNHANELARQLAFGLGAAFEPGLAQRIRDTVPQASLPLKERANNVRGAFAVRRNIEGCIVAVVDDVLTTGTSLNELARTLRAAGARDVIGWVVARTPPP